MLSHFCGELSKTYCFVFSAAAIFCGCFVFYNGGNIMKNTVFKGVATAIVTPFIDGKIDFDAFDRLVEWQIASGVSAIVVAGTTGEGSTLTDAEHKEIIKHCVEVVNKRVAVIAGTGSNDTAYAIELSKYACDVGADALLLVTPYYNKATQGGLYQSFKMIADSVNKPCILYNVPSRTGCNLKPETVLKLADHKNIVAIKEASGDISQVAELSLLVGEKIDIYSGNDDQIVPILSLGGSGVISVLSNICPKETVEICESFFKGDVDRARQLQLKYLKLINALFCEVNPIPVKCAVSKLGYGENSLRLPLTTMEPQNEAMLIELMKNNGLI